MAGSLTGEDKEILRRRLNLLQREYERTAQRLKRAERKEAVRKHVQNRISDQNRQLQLNTSGVSQLSPASPSVSNSSLLSNQPQLLETNPGDGFPSSKKQPSVRFHLPDGSDISPCSTPTCKRSPTHRLRSKRSRLRLQSREKESDTDSQDKAKEGVDERPGEENEQKRSDCDWTKENRLEMERGGENKKADAASGKSEEEKNLNEREGRFGEIEEVPRMVLNVGLRELEGNSDVGLQMCPTAQNSAMNRSPLEVFISQVEVKTSLADQSANANSQSSSSASDQLLMQIHDGQSSGLSKQPGNQKEDDIEEVVGGAGMYPDEGMTVLLSSEKTSFLDSCTVIEGLPFPVEYYIRTTRRMAAAHSSVDLDAVIHSQLSIGRGRRKTKGFSQTRGRGHSSSEASQPQSSAFDQPRSRGRGRRGRRGRKRTRAFGFQSRPCTEDSSDVEPESLTETESSTQSPRSQSVLQTSLAGEPSPQQESTPQPEPIPTPKHGLNTQQFPPNSEVFPIFRRRHGQAERAVSSSQTHTSTNANDLSLISLTQALKVKNVRLLGQLLTMFDIQDFHLPDDEFGQLKLQRLRMSCLNLEPLSPHCCTYNTRRTSQRYSFRTHKKKISSEVQRTESEPFHSELLPPSADPEGSFSLSPINFADKNMIPGNSEQSKRKTGNKLKIDSCSQKSCQSVITSYGEVNDQGTEDRITLMNMEQSDTFEDHSQTSVAGLALITEDKQTPMVYSKEPEEKGGRHTYDLKECRQHEQVDGSSSPSVLNLSMSLTSHMQLGPESFLPSLGTTPHLLSTASPSDSSIQPSPICPSPLALVSTPLESPAVVSTNHTSSPSLNVCHGTLQAQSKTERDLQTPSGPEPAIGVCVSTDTKTVLQNVYNDVCLVSENEHQTKDRFEVGIQHQDTRQPENGLHIISECKIPFQTEHPSQQLPESKPEDQSKSKLLSPSQTDSDSVIKPCASDLSAHGVDGLALNMADTYHMPAELILGMENPAQEVSRVEDTETLSCGTLQKTHMLKALEGGCVLDVCLVHWPSDDWCVCVAGEWSVCVWAQRAGVQEWSLIHTWTFTQSVISLQEVPDSPGLLCVCLGRLEITELRILCCPSIEGQFSQTEVYKGALQSVVAVSDSRLVCCSVPGAEQKIQVFTLSQDCSVAGALSLDTTNRSILTLAAVDRKKDALIGWTECKTLLIWNMKSGHLLQTVHLKETVSMATCLKGYSYKGALCVLFQRGSACDEPNDAGLFTLIALNPLTGKYFTLTSVTSPTDSLSERLIDGDVCESMLVGVFQSGHLTIWDLRGGMTSVLGGGDTQSCRLARWAGPSTLLTGYLNGDVNLYQFKASETKRKVSNKS